MGDQLFDPGPPQCPTCGGTKSIWSDNEGRPVRCPTCDPAPKEPPDFDPAAADVAAKAGMDKALRAQRVAAWKIKAQEWLDMLEKGTVWIADDLIAAKGLPDQGDHRNNSVGAWVGAKSKLGEIEWTGQLRKSERVIGHGNLQREWRKL